MKNGIIDLLKNEGELPDNGVDETNIDDCFNAIEKIGKRQTEYIKSFEISKNLDTRYIGKNLYVYSEVTSTNSIARFLSENGVENGSVVISEIQTSGRGRSGKSWQSPLGGVWLSIILAPNTNHSKIPFITLATGVSVAKTLERIGIENPEIKWPNDIILNDRKVCGILTEAITKLNKIENVIIGVGIDVNMEISELPEELQNQTTTLKRELGKKVDENLLIKLFLEEFEKIMDSFANNEHESILKEWRKRSYTIGKVVEVRNPYSEPYDAYVAGIGKEGELIVEKDDGSLEKIISGECIIKM